MLSKILAKPNLATLYRRNVLARQTIGRCFASSELAEPSPAEVAVAAAHGTQRYASSKDVSAMAKELERRDAAANADYLDMLNNTDARQKYFAALTS